MSMSIGSVSSYQMPYSYQAPQAADFSDAMDAAMDFGIDDFTPIDVSPVVNIDNTVQSPAVKSAENARGSDEDSFRNDHSTSQEELREIQSAMMGFSSRRMYELLQQTVI